MRPHGGAKAVADEQVLCLPRSRRPDVLWSRPGPPWDRSPHQIL